MPGKTWPGWNWLDDLLLPLAGALMAAAWIGPWLDGFSQALTPDRPVNGAGPLSAGLLLAAATLTKFAGRTPRGRAWVVAGGLLAVLVAEWALLYRAVYPLWEPRWLMDLAGQIGDLAAAPLIVGGAAAFLWRWGLTEDWTSHAAVARAFGTGVLALGLALVLTASGLSWLPADLSGAVLVFILSAWSALALAGAQSAFRVYSGETGAVRLRRSWLIVVLAIVGTLFAASLIIMSLASPRGIATLAALLEPVSQLLQAALVLVFVGLAYLAFFILDPLLAVVRRLLERGQPPPPTPPRPLPSLFQDWPGGLAAGNPLVANLMRGLTIAALLLGLVLLFVWAFRRFTATDEEGVQESRDLIWSRDLLRAQLASLLARGRHGPSPLFGALEGAPDDPLTAVRAAYRQVLTWALARGQARPPGQTPENFLAALRGLWPEEAALLEALTRAYAAARYGRVPPSPEQLAALQLGLERLKALTERRSPQEPKRSA